MEIFNDSSPAIGADGTIFVGPNERLARRSSRSPAGEGWRLVKGLLLQPSDRQRPFLSLPYRQPDPYPEITFAPRHIDGHLDSERGFQAKLEGLLKLHGVEHKVLIDARGTLTGDSLVAAAHFSVPYVEWGLRDPSVLFLTDAKEVDIDIVAAAHVTWLTGEKAPTQASKPSSNSKLGKQK